MDEVYERDEWMRYMREDEWMRYMREDEWMSVDERGWMSVDENRRCAPIASEERGHGMVMCERARWGKARLV